MRANAGRNQGRLSPISPMTMPIGAAAVVMVFCGNPKLTPMIATNKPASIAPAHP